MFKQFGVWEIVLILAIVLIIFGVGKLPQVGSSIGKAIRGFKKAQAGEDEEDEKRKKELAASESKDKPAEKTGKS